MNTAEFLEHLREQDIHLSAEGERLRVSAPKGALTPELQAEVARRKPELLASLQERAAQEPRPAAGLRHIRPVENILAYGPFTRVTPLAPGQEAIWELARRMPDTPVYNMYLAFRLCGRLEPDELERALAAVVYRHEGLRSRLVTLDGEPHLGVLAESGFRLEQVDGSRWTEAEATEWARRQAAEPFRLEAVEELTRGQIEAEQMAGGHLERAAASFSAEDGRLARRTDGRGLVRAALALLGLDEWLLVLGMHHMAADGWSWEIFLSELSECFGAARCGHDPRLEALPAQYGDYAAWMGSAGVEAALAGQLAGWQTRLEGAAELRLPGKRLSGSREPYQGARQVLRLLPELAGRARAFSRRRGSTLFVTLYGAFAALLQKISGQNDLLACTPAANRSLPETQGLIGYFNNLLPLRVRLPDGASFLDLTGLVQEAVLDAFTRQAAPFHRVAALPALNRIQPARAVFALQSAAGHSLELEGLQVRLLEVYTGTANFDLFLTTAEQDGGLECVLEYQTARFDEETAGTLLQAYCEALEWLLENPERPVAELVLPALAALDEAAGRNHRAEAGGSPRPAYSAPHSGLEQGLARIWAEELGVAQVGRDDDFFQLGGCSLQALQTFRRAEKELGVSLPLAALYTAPTVSGLAALAEGAVLSTGEARDEARPLAFEALVPVRPHGGRVPFFGVHGITGQILFWRDVVRHLAPDQPFFALQARGIDGLARPRTSIAEMAAAYIEELRRVSPHGPYALGGYSLGGEIAFEMANQLVEMGEEVALLVLFDTSNPVRPVRMAQAAELGDQGQNQSKRSLLYYKLAGHLRRIRERTPGEAIHYIFEDLYKRSRHAMIRALAGLSHRLGRRRPGWLTDAYVDQCHVRALDRYAPQPFKGRVTLFRAKQSLADNPVDDPLGWGPLAQGGIDLHLFDSTHQLLDADFAQEVAAELQACIDAADYSQRQRRSDQPSPSTARAAR